MLDKDLLLPHFPRSYESSYFLPPLLSRKLSLQTHFLTSQHSSTPCRCTCSSSTASTKDSSQSRSHWTSPRHEAPKLLPSEVSSPLIPSHGPPPFFFFFFPFFSIYPPRSAPRTHLRSHHSCLSSGSHHFLLRFLPQSALMVSVGSIHSPPCDQSELSKTRL